MKTPLNVKKHKPYKPWKSKQSMEQNEQQGTELSPKEIKNAALAKQAVELITTMPGLTNPQIADTLNISIPTLYNLIKGEYAQQLITRELHERKTRVDTRLEELYNSTPTNPSNQRFAVKIEADIIKALSDKLYPTKTENTNININIDLNQLQQTIQTHKEAIARLPPHMRQQYQTNINQIRKEWNQQNTEPQQ